MRLPATRERLRPVVDVAAALRAALVDLADQELSYSTGHLAAILNTCLFAPSLLTFWFVNGVVDFSTAVAIGAVASPAGIQVRLVAYVLLVPTFLAARAVVHLLHPVHRRQVLAGSCPNTRYLSLDWVSMGILTTGLPLAVQDFGPWVATVAVLLVGVFLLPRRVPARRAQHVKLLALAAGALLFAYANYGGAVPVLPRPDAVLGPVATFAFGDDTTAWLMRLFNSALLGPVLVGAVGLVTNRVLTRPELAAVPLVRHTLPRRDPDRVVLTSAAFGTAFYLAVVAALTGRFVVLP